MGSPCAAWVTEADLPTEGRPDLPAGTSWGELALGATEVLFNLSGQRWSGDCGEHTAVLEHTCRCASCGSLPTPVVDGGQVFNVTCCQPTALRLPDEAVRAITAVTVGRVARDPSSYVLARGGLLVDRTGHGWAACARTVSVTYETGYLPPATGKRAAALLAFELGKAAAGLATNLPQRAVTLTRQGVTIGLLDSFRYLEAGRTGVYLIDLWLASVNRPPMGSGVWSPDLPVARRI